MLNYLRELINVRRSAINWYDAVLAEIGIMRHPVVYFRNGTKFFYAKHFFHYEMFLDEPYKCLNVKDRVVFDIGAYNGDSAIYFSRRGASRVYAFEPFPLAFYWAKRNIDLNGLTNIELHNWGIASSNSSVLLNPECKKGRVAKLTEQAADGVRVKVRSLSSVIDEFGIVDAVMKIDCEGCEFDIILNTNRNALKVFSEIVVEYHRPRRKLVESLENAGYRVNDFGEVLEEETGILHAKRVEQCY